MKPAEELIFDDGVIHFIKVSIKKQCYETIRAGNTLYF
jgi:hypothetical protein